MGLLLLLAMVPLGYLVGRRWIVLAVPFVLVVALVVQWLVDDRPDPCEPADGCGADPFLTVLLWSLVYAGLAMGLLALGVRLRRRGHERDHRREQSAQ